MLDGHQNNDVKINSVESRYIDRRGGGNIRFLCI
jgi:hypothetical protein